MSAKLNRLRKSSDTHSIDPTSITAPEIAQLPVFTGPPQHSVVRRDERVVDHESTRQRATYDVLGFEIE
jgi:hypothetical protein